MAKYMFSMIENGEEIKRYEDAEFKAFSERTKQIINEFIDREMRTGSDNKGKANIKNVRIQIAQID